MTLVILVTGALGPCFSMQEFLCVYMCVCVRVHMHVPRFGMQDVVFSFNPC